MIRALLGSAVLSVAASGCAISVQQEIELGTEYAAQIDQQLPVVIDPAIQRELDDGIAPVLAVAERQDLPWRFRVINSKVVNAFAVPGGFLYFTRGLIEHARTYAEFVGVVGHEIAHVDRRHSVSQMKKAQIANIGVAAGVLILGRPPTDAEAAAINVTGAAIFAKFSRDDEREADEVAIQYMTLANINPRGLVGLFETLGLLQEREPSAIEAFFASHPMTKERIARVESLIAASPQAQRAVQNGITARRSFDRLQERVRALPPPPERRQR